MQNGDTNRHAAGPDYPQRITSNQCGQRKPRPHQEKGDDQSEELRRQVFDLLHKKEVSHYLPEGRFGNTKHFAMIGG